MEATSGTPHLLTDVRFSVSRKGYDPDEVDNFLERVSAAVAQLQDKLRQAAGQAESAEARATEATKAQAVLQARIDALEGELAAAREGQALAPAAPARRPEEDAEQASKVLLLAQRTADAAIEDANATARSTIVDARSQAASMVSEAEQEAARLLAQARTDADELLTNRRQAIADEVRQLEGVRESLSGDIASLERHVAEQRGVLQASLARVQAVLDDPSTFRVQSAPAVSSVGSADVPSAEEAVPSPPEAPTARPDGPWQPVEAASPWSPAGSGGGGDGGNGGNGAASSPEVEEQTGSTADAGGDDDGDQPDTGQVPPVAAVFDGPAAAPTPASSLFAVQDDRPTVAHDTVGGAESPLGPPDEKADAAMRAFFEAEFDDDPGRGAR